jgi:hypothetical protein
VTTPQLDKLAREQSFFNIYVNWIDENDYYNFNILEIAFGYKDANNTIRFLQCVFSRNRSNTLFLEIVRYQIPGQNANQVFTQHLIQYTNTNPLNYRNRFMFSDQTYSIQHWVYTNLRDITTPPEVLQYLDRYLQGVASMFVPVAEEITTAREIQYGEDEYPLAQAHLAAAYDEIDPIEIHDEDLERGGRRRRRRRI